MLSVPFALIGGVYLMWILRLQLFGGVATTVIGLLPLLWATGTGSDVMKPIAVPLIGGMVTSTIHVLLVTPIIFLFMKRRSYDMKQFIAVITLALALGCQQTNEQTAATPEPAPAAPAPAEAPDGVQTASLNISGGEYQPAAITVKAGVPLRLQVTRDEKPGCGDVFTIPSQNISRPIPVNQVTTIEFTPQQAGDLEFTCGMKMMRGKIVVQ